MPVILGKSGVNKELKEIYLGNSGVNKKEKELYLGKGGVNKQVYKDKVVYFSISGTFNLNNGNDENYGKSYYTYPNRRIQSVKYTQRTVAPAGGYYEFGAAFPAGYKHLCVETTHWSDTMYIELSLSSAKIVRVYDGYGISGVTNFEYIFTDTHLKFYTNNVLVLNYPWSNYTEISNFTPSIASTIDLTGHGSRTAATMQDYYIYE